MKGVRILFTGQCVVYIPCLSSSRCLSSQHYYLLRSPALSLLKKFQLQERHHLSSLPSFVQKDPLLCYLQRVGGVIKFVKEFEDRRGDREVERVFKVKNLLKTTWERDQVLFVAEATVYAFDSNDSRQIRFSRSTI